MDYPLPQYTNEGLYVFPSFFGSKYAVALSFSVPQYYYHQEDLGCCDNRRPASFVVFWRPHREPLQFTKLCQSTRQRLYLLRLRLLRRSKRRSIQQPPANYCSETCIAGKTRRFFQSRYTSLASIGIDSFMVVDSLHYCENSRPAQPNVYSSLFPKGGKRYGSCLSQRHWRIPWGIH